MSRCNRMQRGSGDRLLHGPSGYGANGSTKRRRRSSLLASCHAPIFMRSRPPGSKLHTSACQTRNERSNTRGGNDIIFNSYGRPISSSAHSGLKNRALTQWYRSIKNVSARRGGTRGSEIQTTLNGKRPLEALFLSAPVFRPGTSDRLLRAAPVSESR